VIERRNKGKEQDHLKEENLGHLRQGQRLDTTETKHAHHKGVKTPKQPKKKSHKSPPCTYAHSPELVPPLSIKPVRPVPRTGHTGFQNGQDDLTRQNSPQKTKNAKEMHKLPLDNWNRF
jgi:hypothetical protein